MLVNGAGVSPSQTPIEAILHVDLYGKAVLLEEVGKVITEGGVGVTISSQSGWRMPQLTAEEDAALRHRIFTDRSSRRYRVSYRKK